MGHQVLAPRGLNRGLESENKHAFEAHFLSQLIRGERLAEAHFRVPQEFGCTPLHIGRMVVFHGLCHSCLLLRAHRECLCAVLHVVDMVAHGYDGSFHLLHGAAEPLAAYTLHTLAFQHAVDIVVVETAAVRVHGALPQYDAVGHAAVRPLGGVLLRHAPVHAYGGVTHFQQAAVLGVGVLVGIDHGMGGRALGEEVSWHWYRRFPSPYLWVRDYS